jgi:uncharacterized protein (TIGR00369 family)
MITMPVPNIPPGFEPVVGFSDFSELIGPLYKKHTETIPVFGFFALQKHCNSQGFVHGGVFPSVADTAMGYSIAFSRDPRIMPVLTVNLSVDYAGIARIGDWIEVETEIQKIGRTMAFANCYFVKAGKRIARASGVFSVAKG